MDGERFQHSKQTAAEEVRQRLAYKAERLLDGTMRETFGRQHKWATGKQKWQATQRAGYIAHLERTGQTEAAVRMRASRSPGKPTAPAPAKDPVLEYIDGLRVLQELTQRAGDELLRVEAELKLLLIERDAEVPADLVEIRKQLCGE